VVILLLIYAIYMLQDILHIPLQLINANLPIVQNRLFFIVSSSFVRT
jgi:hypothetical protein